MKYPKKYVETKFFKNVRFAIETWLKKKSDFGKHWAIEMGKNFTLWSVSPITKEFKI